MNHLPQYLYNKVLNIKTISILLDPTKVMNHYGNGPINGIISNERFFKSITEVIQMV
jgi:hypothetical protein